MSLLPIIYSQPPPTTAKASRPEIRELVRKTAQALKPGGYFVYPLEPDEINIVREAEAKRARKLHASDWAEGYRRVRGLINARLRVWNAPAYAHITTEDPPRIIIKYKERTQ